MKELLQSLFALAGPYSVLVRAGIWFVISIVIIASTDTTGNNPRRIKENIGLFVLFLVVSGGLIYLLFGIVPIA